MAAREFDVAKETLRRRLGENHLEPGPDGCYGTLQLTTALYGDLYGAKLRTQNEQAEKLRLENAVTRAELLNRQKLEQALAQVADSMVSRITASNLDCREQEDLLRELSQVPLQLTAEVAYAQTRFRRSKGKRSDRDEGEDE
jgi:hypothetical protein